MARSRTTRRRSGERRKPRGPVFRWFERVVLGAGMSIVASVIERRLLKAIKGGGVKAAPRTAEAHEAPEAQSQVTAAPDAPG